jgi:hypothetical protein
VSVILWLHGYYVKDFSTNIFGPDDASGNNMLRESVDRAGEDVVLIAPWCGWKYKGLIRLCSAWKPVNPWIIVSWEHARIRTSCGAAAGTV